MYIHYAVIDRQPPLFLFHVQAYFIQITREVKYAQPIQVQIYPKPPCYVHAPGRKQTWYMTFFSFTLIERIPSQQLNMKKIGKLENWKI